MKTAISLPDALYNEAEKTAQAMGIPRSQLFARALKEFIEHHRRANITEQLNRVYSKMDNSDESIVNSGLDAMRDLTKDDSW
jgi:metal-responsive CopG/Arc/MetJ family transcriptional regulator